MTEQGFGYYGQQNEGNPFEQQEETPVQQPPGWYRQAMDKMGEQQRELRAQIEALTAENNRNKVADVLESKGFARSAAALYSGGPDKVDEWLTQHGASLARAEGTPAAPPVQQSGPPQSTVPAEGQQAMQQMADAGAGGVVSMSSDDDIAAALRASGSPEDFEKIAQAYGWQHSLGDRF